MHFTSLESTLISWFASHAEEAELRAAICRALPVKRTASAYGVFVTLDDPAKPLAADQRAETNPWPGPLIRSPHLLGGADCALYITDNGLPECLEIWTYGDAWRDDIEEFELTLTH